MPVPQLILTLTPSGGIVAELPAANGARRQVPIEDIETCQRILQAQLRAETSIGLDGAPTSRQAIHWAKHSRDKPGPTCPWCREAGWTSRPGRKPSSRVRTRKSEAGNTVRTGKDLVLDWDKYLKTKGKIVIPDPTGQSLLPIVVTRSEARKLGWKPPPLVTKLSPEDLGI